MLIKVTGEVLHGKKYGRTIGFPTVNLALSRRIESGIYRGSVEYEGESRPAGIYIPEDSAIIEAHILDFQADLYGETVTIIVEEKLRDNEYFPDEDELRRKIATDIDVVRALWKNK